MIHSTRSARLWFLPRWYVVVIGFAAGAAVCEAVDPQSPWVGGLIMALVVALICFWRPLHRSTQRRRGSDDSGASWAYFGGDDSSSSCGTHGDCGGDSGGGDGGGGGD